MKNRRSLLIASANFELHRFLENITSNYDFTLLLAENAKEGLGILRLITPDCLIFDLDILKNLKNRKAIKKKLQESGVPILFLNDRENRDRHHAASRAPLEVEPIVKFVMDNKNKSRRNSKKSFLRRLLFFLGIGSNRRSSHGSTSA
jgi:chemotaxis response regulator CheB